MNLETGSTYYEFHCHAMTPKLETKDETQCPFVTCHLHVAIDLIVIKSRSFGAYSYRRHNYIFPYCIHSNWNLGGLCKWQVSKSTVSTWNSVKLQDQHHDDLYKEAVAMCRWITCMRCSPLTDLLQPVSRL